MSRYGSEYGGLFANLDSRTKRALAAAQESFRGQPIMSRGQIQQLSKYSLWGKIFGPSAIASSYSTGSQTFAVLYYISLTFFIIFLSLMFIHYTIYPIFSFSPNDTGLISIPTASDRQITYKSGPAAFDKPATFTKLPACSYTLGADVYLSGNFMLAQIPRVILYRDSAPVITGGTTAGLQATYPNTNLIVWLDPVKNDLYVSVLAQTDGTNTVIETSAPIENVPIRKVFRLAVVFAPNFVELYVNGKLERSMVINGTVLSINENNTMYSSIQPIQNNVMLGNLTMWPRILTAREISVNESAPIKDALFFFKGS
jgi:hypothetical protein